MIVMETEKGKWREELLCPKNGLDLGSKQASKQAWDSDSSQGQVITCCMYVGRASFQSKAAS